MNATAPFYLGFIANLHGMSDTVYIHSFGIASPLQPFPAQDSLQNIMIGLEKEYPFCSNPDCRLYVRAGDPGVIGSGNWAEFPDGRIVGRSIYSGVYLCDVCGREWHPVEEFRAALAM